MVFNLIVLTLSEEPEVASLLASIATNQFNGLDYLIFTFMNTESSKSHQYQS